MNNFKFSKKSKVEVKPGSDSSSEMVNLSFNLVN